MTWEIITGDCLDWLREREAGSVDAVVTDPPYGIGEAAGKNRGRTNRALATDYGCSAWDNERLPEHVLAAVRVGRESVIFGGNYYADLLPPSPSWVVWVKAQKSDDFADVELAWTSHKRAAKKIDWLWRGYWQEPGQPRDKRVHPTQKPLGMMRWVIRNYTNEGDIVLDPFCGSGTTGVACIETGRSFIGIEINPEYADIARERCAKSERQPDLFVKAPKPQQESLI